MRHGPAKLTTLLFTLLFLITGCGSGGGEDTLLLTTQEPAPLSLEVSMAPKEGPSTGGTTVTLTGQGADLVRGVNIEGTPASSLKIVDERTVTFVTPPHEPGTVHITLYTSLGTATLLDAFTYVKPPSPRLTLLVPNAIPLEGARGLELRGSGFMEGKTLVNLGHLEVAPSQVTPTSLLFNAPPREAGTIPVSVTTFVDTSNAVEGGLTYTEGPTVNSLAPHIGPLQGLDSVMLTGTGFVENKTIVHLDGQEITPRSVTPTTLVFDAPPHAEGLVDVSVTTPGGDSDEVPGGFLYAGPPDIISVSPSRGKVGGGETITINGSNLFAVDKVTLGEASADSLEVNDEGTQLTVTAPAHSVGLVDVEVSTPVGTDTSVDAYEYQAKPEITSVSPAMAFAFTQTTVTLSGSGFQNASEVRFEGHEADSFTVDSDSQITATTAGHSSGSYDIVVVTPGGTATASDAFTFISTPDLGSVTPDAGRVNGGEYVTISGLSLSGTTSVTIGGKPAHIREINYGHVDVEVPGGTAGPADVVVTNPAGSDTLVGGYNYVPYPSLSRVSPNTGPVSGGTDVTLIGSWLETAYSVRVGGRSVSFSSSPNGLHFTTPPGEPGFAEIVVTTVGGTGYFYNAFTYVDQ